MTFRLMNLTGALVLALGMVACTSEPEPLPGAPTLSISPSPRTIVDDGSSSEVRVTATNADGNPGTGDVTLEAAAGAFDNDLKTVTLTLVDGKATTGFRCLKATDVNCTGTVRITGTWSGTSGGASVMVTSQGTQPPPDNTDGGTTTDGGTDPTAPEVGAPANIVFDSTSTKAVLGIRSSNLEVSTPVSFVVTDLNQARVPNVTVNFDVRGAGGVALSAYSAVTNNDGVATTTLLSGDEVGIATVRATIPNTNLAASSLGTPIVGARPSDEGFTVSCEQINLAANATETPPRQDLNTECTAQLVDRFKNPVVLTTSVNWYAEAGSIRSPISSDGPGTGPGGGDTFGNGIVTTQFRTAGKWPPADVAPLVGVTTSDGTNEEFSEGRRNPRDMLVTILAVTSGEEEFYDGSGVSNGVKDGKWNPGEWFVDLPEPFLDENDNQQYDPGEMFIDTQRLNCATGEREPKNGKWDGPNGCWDGDILIWRPTHVLYSGFATVLGGPGSTFIYDPPSYPAGSPVGTYTIPKGALVTVHTTVHDDYFNPMSPSASMGVTYSGTLGTVAMNPDGRLNSRYYGFSIFHERLVATDAPGTTKGYTTNGTVCDPSRPAPAGAASDPKLARCVREYRITNFIKGNQGQILMSGRDPNPSDDSPGEIGTATVNMSNEYSGATDSITVIMQ